MKAHFYLQGQAYSADLTLSFNLSYPLRNGPRNPKAWYVGDPVFEPVRMGDFIGSVAQGSPVNFYNVRCNPHGNGTHTECIGHITPEHHVLSDVLPSALVPCQVVTLEAVKLDNDHVIQTLPDTWSGIEAIAIRTRPNPNPTGTLDFSNTNPPYFDAAVLQALAERGILHVLTDLPSVDREEDGGQLAGHKAWWQYPHAPRHFATITEFAYFPADIADGLYLLNLQVPNWALDAAPSRPLLFPVEKITA